MTTRPRGLPAGWYPAGRSQTIREIEGFLRASGEAGPGERAPAGEVRQALAHRHAPLVQGFGP